MENAASLILSFGAKEAVIIRSGSLGAFTLSQHDTTGRWVDAFWTPDDVDRVVDVTGAGNAFLGGLAAGLTLSNGNIHEGVSPNLDIAGSLTYGYHVATLYATISAAFTIEQAGLPLITQQKREANIELWNNEDPFERLNQFRKRMVQT